MLLFPALLTLTAVVYVKQAQYDRAIIDRIGMYQTTGSLTTISVKRLPNKHAQILVVRMSVDE